MSAENESQYPLGENDRDTIKAKSGRPLSEMTLDYVRTGDARPDDLSAEASTLIVQAEFARQAGYLELAENLARAAEMTRIPNDEILEIYEALRPGRSSYHQLLSLSQKISSVYDAERTGAYIREAAEVYRDTGLLKYNV
ncbi:MAG: diol dehydratase small subunit [Roseovarius sp.]|nr:diol dehydratase small subunit [Roseovarius sp.]